MSSPKTPTPDARRTPRFAGVCTFCRFPTLAEATSQGRQVDWAIYGAPFDGGVTYRPGARFGPRAVREASQFVRPYHTDLDVMLTDVFSLVDAGDAPVAPFSCEQNLESICRFATELPDAEHMRLLAVGGDHSIALANMRATWTRRGKPRGGLALIHFDSHIDTVDLVWGEKKSHASVFRLAIEEGLVDPNRMMTIGVKGPLNRRDDWDYARQKGVKVLTYDQWRREGARQVLDFAGALDRDEVYLSFDIDVVDPAFAPGTGTPSIGGFSSAEAIELLRCFAGVNLVGADLVEVLPDRDPAGITSALAAQVLFETLCLDACRVARAG